MKKSLIFVGMLAIAYANAQEGNVGINTDNPKATLEVNVANVNTSNDTNQGIIAPRLTKNRIAQIAQTKLVEGTLVYATDTTYAGTNTKVSKITEKGYYYYNGTEWVKVQHKDSEVDTSLYSNNGTLSNNRTVNQNGKWINFNDGGFTIKGNTEVYNPLTIRTMHTEGHGGISIEPNSVYEKRIELNSTPDGDIRLWANGNRIYVNRATGNVGIGTIEPTAKLDVAGNARVQTLPAGATSDQVITTDANGNLRKLPLSSINTTYTAGNGITISGSNNAIAVNPAGIALGGDVTGNANANTVAKIQGRAVANTAPTNGQVLKWNQAEGVWKPENDANTNTTYEGSTSVVLSGNSFQRAALTGDVSSAQNNNTVTINTGAVTGAKIANETITADKLAPGVIPTDTNTNIYTNDGTLQANRTVNLNGKWINFNDGGFTIKGNTEVYNPLTIRTMHTEGHGGISIEPNAVYNKRIEFNTTPDGDIRLWANGDRIYANRATGNVGIGTIEPTAKLDVAGNARVQTLPAGATSDQVVTTDANGNLRKLPLSSVNTTYTAGTGLALTGTAFSVKYGNEAGTAVQGNDSRVNNGQTAFSWGNHATAGYLKTLPIASATQLGGVKVGANLNITADGVLSATDTNTNIYTNNGTLSANRTVNMNGKNLLFTGVTNTGGRIGLGTNTPTSILSIKGTGGSSDDITIDSYSNTPGNTSTIFLQRFRGTDTAPTAVQVGDDIGGIVYKGYTSSGSLKDALTLISKVREVTANEIKANLQISVDRVGIGTNSPAEKLEVNGAVKVGNTNNKCTTENRGAIKFVNDNFYGCKSTGWVQLNN